MDQDTIDAMVEKLKRRLKVGSKFHLFRDGPWHVRGFVDDTVVCRIWQRRRQSWHYEAHHIEKLAIMNIQGVMR